jgi:hypothetical protein
VNQHCLCCDLLHFLCLWICIVLDISSRRSWISSFVAVYGVFSAVATSANCTVRGFIIYTNCQTLL